MNIFIYQNRDVQRLSSSRPETKQLWECNQQEILSSSDRLPDPWLRRLSHLFSCQMLNPHFHQRSEPFLPPGSLFIILDALSGEKDAGKDGLAFRFPTAVSIVPFLVRFTHGGIVTAEQLSSANEEQFTPQETEGLIQHIYITSKQTSSQAVCVSVTSFGHVI